MKRLGHGGYTIVEVMMFLVITGVLLLTGLFVFNGQQQRTQFSQSVREFEGQVRTVVNEVSSGYYPKNTNYTCSVVTPGAGPSITKVTPGTGTPLGEDTACIFMGKVFRFTKGETYKAYAVVGQRQDASQQEVTVLGDPLKGPKQKLIGSDVPSDPTSEQNFRLGWGTTVTDVRDVEAGTSVGALAFLMSLGAYNSSSDLVSGSQTVDVYPLPSTSLTSSVTELQAATGLLNSAGRNHGTLAICLLSGNGDRRAAVLIGGNERQLSIDSVIFETTNPYECPTT